MAKSIMDYIFRWLASPSFSTAKRSKRSASSNKNRWKKCTIKKVVSLAAHTPRGGAPVEASISSVTGLYQQDAPPCPDCGAIMIRSGACYKCMNCGAVSGCS